MGVVELLKQGQGVGIVLGGQRGGKLRGQDRIVGLLRQGGAKHGFGFRVLLVQQQNVTEAGGGVCVFRVFRKDAAIGFLRGRQAGRPARPVPRPRACLRAFR